MDSIYKSESSFSPLINISEYFSDEIFNKLLPCKRLVNAERLDSDKLILELMEVELSDDEFQSLKKSTCPDLLKSEDDLEIKTFSQTRQMQNMPLQQIFPDDLTLATLKKLQLRSKYNKKYKNRTKYIREIKCWPKKIASSDAPDLEPGKEIVLTITMYMPFLYESTHNDGQLPYLQGSFDILGSQKISVLMKTFFCSNNSTMRNIPDQDSTRKPSIPEDYLKQDYGSSFIFIEDTFYNNLSQPDNKDYSKVIIDWAKKRENLGPFKTADMASVLFKDLTLRLGFPQVIQHQGNCEHLFLISNIRLLSPHDVCYSSYYPATISLPIKSIRTCYICREYAASRIVYDSDRTIFDPCLFCESCFVSYNYINGQPVSKFRAYTYENQSYAVHKQYNISQGEDSEVVD